MSSWCRRLMGYPSPMRLLTFAFNDNGRVSSYSSSFVEHTGAADINPSVSLADAIATAEETLYGTYNGRPATLEFVVQPNGFAALTHVIQIQNENAGTWYEAFVDAHHNTLLSVTDFVAKASYLVIPLFAEDSNTMGFYNIVDPEDWNASPNGWHQEFDTATNATDGNNAAAYTGSELINFAVETSPVLNFSYVVDPTQDPTIGANVPAAITNAFFVVNSFHDFAYRYGFTETTFNFQSNNFNKGGEEYDRVLVSVQDTEGINGADFAILPDGQSSKMRLFLYNNLFPRRDSSLRNDIIIHECQHGATHRMTGGGTARCFQTLEAAAIAEGYADAMADAISQNQNPVDYVFGRGLSNSPNGLRTYPYSMSQDINPLRYSSLSGMTDAHAMGEVWANILHKMSAELVYAFEWTWLYLLDPDQFAGNVIFYHLLFDALLLQPCNPTFVQARDAWIQADANRYDGAYKCLLWLTFASKGLGVNAADYIDDGNVPPECHIS
ncbi:Fungalysin metallopeptidase-domain-containing protein [Lactarius psammicola]|nr:Fungalysin metallopeptidase-domain-containing protein [Lactarius psammicola]